MYCIELYEGGIHIVFVSYCLTCIVWFPLYVHSILGIAYIHTKVVFILYLYCTA